MKRVAAYCRVSTGEDGQLNSLANQKQFFEQYIKKNPDWHFSGLYIDEGISGTNIQKRTGFKQMIADAKAGYFDLLLTKEISRFARNTLDSIFYTRQLKDFGVGVFFLNDNINTLDPDAELRLTIMSSIAQEESRKISERVCWGQKRQMEKGVVFGNSVYGYYLHHGSLTPNEAEAKTVRLIFDLYLREGLGSHILARELENKAIPSPSGEARWQNATILKILKNEKYAGTLKQKKYITTDYLTHKKKLNRGEEEYIIIEDHHEPIIDKATFILVQQEIERRRKTAVSKSRYSGSYAFSGKIECARCGARFKRRVQNRKGKNPQVVWQCTEASRYGKEKTTDRGTKSGCNCPTLKEEVLQDCLLRALAEALGPKASLVDELKKAVNQVLAGQADLADPGFEADMARITKRKHKLLNLYLDEAISPLEFKKMAEQCEKQMEIFGNKLALFQETQSGFTNSQAKIDAIGQNIESLLSLSTFDESICREVLEKVVVQGREKITLFLRNGDEAAIFFYP